MRKIGLGLVAAGLALIATGMVVPWPIDLALGRGWHATLFLGGIGVVPLALGFGILTFAAVGANGRGRTRGPGRG